MRKLSGIIALLIFTILMACSRAPKGVAAITLIDSVYDAGAVKADSFKHSFVIKSTGNADLKIDSVSASCDCVDINWQKNPIKPGQNAFINVTVKPGLSSNRATKRMRYVMVKTNTVKGLSIFRIFYTI